MCQMIPFFLKIQLLAIAGKHNLTQYVLFHTFWFEKMMIDKVKNTKINCIRFSRRKSKICEFLCNFLIWHFLIFKWCYESKKSRRYIMIPVFKNFFSEIFLSKFFCWKRLRFMYYLQKKKTKKQLYQKALEKSLTNNSTS